MQSAAQYWKGKVQDVPDEYGGKFYSMAAFCSKFKASTVPDPYYGGSQGFEDVLDLLDDACEGLLQHIQRQEAS